MRKEIIITSNKLRIRVRIGYFLNIIAGEENKEGNNWYKIIFKRLIESNTSDSMNFSEFYNVKLH